MSHKTHKGLKKRLKKTKHGKLLYKRTGNQHLMRSKDSKRSRQLRQERELPKGEKKAIEKQYGGL